MTANTRIFVILGLTVAACQSETVPVGDRGDAAGSAGVASNSEQTSGDAAAANSGGGSPASPDDEGADSAGVAGTSGSTASPTVGPDGGVLESNGVRIVIPPDALDQEVAVEFVADEDTRTLSVGTDVLLQIPARVEVGWSGLGEGDTVVLSSPDGSTSELATVERDDAGFYYESDRLADQRLVRRELVEGCWEQGWSYRTVERGEKCAGSTVLGPTVCSSAFPTLDEASSSEPMTEVDVAAVRPPLATQSESSDTRLVDVREADDVEWHGVQVPKTLGTCSTDRDCAGDEIRADGECEEGTCSFDRATSETYVLRFEAAVDVMFAARTLQMELPEYSLYLMAALDTSGRFHGPESLHYTGRAVDVSLWNAEEDRAATQDELDENLPKLAPILMRSGFTWVSYESPRHLHASVGTSCVNPRQRCACDAPAVEADPSNLTCDPTRASNNCPACLPQHFSCESGRPPVEGCISNGVQGFCCPPLPEEFPCVPTAPERAGMTDYGDGAHPSCETATLEDGTPLPYAYSCAAEELPDCFSFGSSFQGGCGALDDPLADSESDAWFAAQSFCCSRPYSD